MRTLWRWRRYKSLKVSVVFDGYWHQLTLRAVLLLQSVEVINALLMELLSRTTEFIQPNPGTERTLKEPSGFPATSADSPPCLCLCLWQRTGPNWVSSIPCPDSEVGRNQCVTRRQRACWETACCTMAKSSEQLLNLVQSWFWTAERLQVYLESCLTMLGFSFLSFWLIFWTLSPLNNCSDLCLVVQFLSTGWNIDPLVHPPDDPLDSPPSC